jgi:hypothetical protein
MWAQGLVEYGMLDAAIAGVMGIPAQIDAALGDGASFWIFLGSGLLFLFWVFKRR